jgi:hypothetical protein
MANAEKPEGYDPVGDARTGRPPLAVDAERMRKEAAEAARRNESTPEDDDETGGDVDSDETDTNGHSILDDLAEEVTGEAIDAPAMLPAVKPVA